MKLYTLKRSNRVEVWCDDGGRIELVGCVEAVNEGSPLMLPSLLDQIQQVIGEISYRYLEEDPQDPLPMERADADALRKSLEEARRNLSAALELVESSLSCVEEAANCLPETEAETDAAGGQP